MGKTFQQNDLAAYLWLKILYESDDKTDKNYFTKL